MNTSSIVLKPDLAERVRRITKTEGAAVEDFVNQAIQERLERLEIEKLKTEVQVFERMHPELVKQHLGKFVAVHNGQVVDAGADFEALFIRLQQRLGDTPVLIRPVTAELTPELRAPSPRLEQNAK